MPTKPYAATMDPSVPLSMQDEATLLHHSSRLDLSATAIGPPLTASAAPSHFASSAASPSSSASSLPNSSHLTPTSPSTHTTSPAPFSQPASPDRSPRAVSPSHASPSLPMEPSSAASVTPSITSLPNQQHETVQESSSTTLEGAKVYNRLLYPFSRKISRVLSINFNNSDSADAMVCLSSFLSEAAAFGKGNMRHELLLEKVKKSDELLKLAAPIGQTLEKLVASVATMDKAVQKASEELHLCGSASLHVLNAAEALQTEKKRLIDKQAACNDFLDYFKLSKSHVAILTDTEQSVEPEFFEALEALKALRSKAEQYVFENPKNASFGEDILAKTAELKEIAYQRLFNFVQHRIKVFISSDEEALLSFSSSPAEALFDADIVEKGGLKGTVSAAIGTQKGGKGVAGIIKGNESPNSMEMHALAVFYAHRPRYFDHCAKEIAKWRRYKLVQRFHVALHKGDPLVNINPIEMHAYDPLRFIGDMLAWIHENAVAEREFLTRLLPFLVFHEPSQFVSDFQNATAFSSHGKPLSLADEATEASERVSVNGNSLLDIVFEGLYAPFHIRVEQAMQSKPSIVIVYKIMQLLTLLMNVLYPIMSVEASRHSFHTTVDSHNTDASVYAVTHRNNTASTNGATVSAAFQPFVSSPDAHTPVFINCLMTLYDEAQILFQQLLEERSTQVLSLPSSTHYTLDLSPPQFVKQAGNVLGEVLEVYDTMHLPEQEDDESIATILDALMNPIVNFCRQIAHSLPEGDAAIYLINCYLYLQKILIPHSYTVRRVEVFMNLVEEQMQTLIVIETEGILQKLGFQRRLEILDSYESAGDDKLSEIRAHPAFHPISLSACFNSFYSILCVGSLLSLPLVDKLRTRDVRSEARSAVTRNVANAYDRLYQISKPMGMQVHDPSRIRTLLDVL